MTTTNSIPDPAAPLRFPARRVLVGLKWGARLILCSRRERACRFLSIVLGSNDSKFEQEQINNTGK